MQTNRNAGCLSLKRYGHRQPVHNPLSGYFERRWVQEYRGRRERGSGSDPHPPDSGGTNARRRNGKSSGSDPHPPNLGGASARTRNGKGGGSDPHPPDSGGTNARTRNGKSSGSDPLPPNLGGAGTGIQPHILLAQGAFVHWKSPAWGELQATNLMVRRPPDTLPTTVTRCVRRPSAARPTAAAQPALHNYGNAVRGLRPHQNGIFESTIQLTMRFHDKRDQNIIYE